MSGSLGRLLMDRGIRRPAAVWQFPLHICWMIAMLSYAARAAR
jgi:hypothetical protein